MPTKPNHTKITVTIITLNEAENIQACIESAWKVADEIIVVDSLSVDNTCEIAGKLGARVFKQSYLGDGLQKDFGVQFANNHWILHLDADERMDDEMVAEIKSIDYMGTPYDAFAFRRKNYIGSRWQKVWYPDYMIRLYHKDRCRFAPTVGHTSLTTQNYRRMNGNIIHYSFKDLSDYLVRTAKYSQRDAKVLFESNRKVSSFDPLLHGLASFIKYFFFKKGFAYGLDGLNASLLGALRSYLKYAHVIAMQDNAAMLDVK